MNLRILFGSLALVFGMAHQAIATPSIVVGSHLAPDTGTFAMDVFVTGGDPIGGIDMVISLGDEGNGVADPADPGEPKIVSIDVVTGTIFGSNSGNAAPGQVLFTSDQFWQIDNITDGSPTAVPANGKIFTIVIDVTGVDPSHVWPLRIFTGLGNSSYSNDTVVGQFLGSNGVVLIVPEPSSIALAAFAIAGLAACGWRRKCRG